MATMPAMVAARFTGSVPHLTKALEITAPESIPLEPLLDALAARGWSRAEQIAPGYPASRTVEDPSSVCGYREVSLGFLIRDVVVTAPGTALFDAWTPAEHDTFVASACDVLAEFGFDGIAFYENDLEPAV